MKRFFQGAVLASGAALGCAGSAAAQEDLSPLRGRAIAYAMTMEEWAMHKTPGAKAECPNGMLIAGWPVALKGMV